MTDRVIIPLGPLGVLELPREVYEQHLRPNDSPEPKKSVVAEPEAALLDAKGVGRALSLPVSWIREKARQGEIPSTHAGRYVRFDLVAVRKALAAKDHGSIGRA